MADMARMFLGRNRTTPVSAFERFGVAVTAGYPTEVAISEIVAGLGLKVGYPKIAGNVFSVGAMRRVYDRHGAHARCNRTDALDAEDGGRRLLELARRIGRHRGRGSADGPGACGPPGSGAGTGWSRAAALGCAASPQPRRRLGSTGGRRRAFPATSLRLPGVRATSLAAAPIEPEPTFARQRALPPFELHVGRNAGFRGGRHAGPHAATDVAAGRDEQTAPATRHAGLRCAAVFDDSAFPCPAAVPIPGCGRAAAVDLQRSERPAPKETRARSLGEHRKTSPPRAAGSGRVGWRAAISPACRGIRPAHGAE